MNITDIAREAGFDLDGMANMLYTVRGNHAQLERFATLLKAAHLEELLAGVDMPEPVAHIAWRNGKPNYEGDDAICEDAVWPVDSDDDRESKAVVTIDQCRETVAAAVARKDAEIAHLQLDCQTEAATVVSMTCERDALTAERDDWKQKTHYYHEKYHRTVAERDALKRDVQVLREALQKADRLCPAGSETEIVVRAALEATK